jgi:hypothetical protein
MRISRIIEIAQSRLTADDQKRLNLNKKDFSVVKVTRIDPGTGKRIPGPYDHITDPILRKLHQPFENHGASTMFSLMDVRLKDGHFSMGMLPSLEFEHVGEKVKRIGPRPGPHDPEILRRMGRRW